MRFGLAMVFCLARPCGRCSCLGRLRQALSRRTRFDEGSGATATDASGNGRTGAVTGATWATGRYGGALSFDGTNDYVGLPALGTFYNIGLHARGLGAEGNDEERRRDRRHVGRQRADALDRPSGDAPPAHARRQPLLVSRLGAEPARRAVAASRRHASTARRRASTSTAPRWRHETVSGAVGTSNTWRIGAYGSVPGGFFDGVIDEIRVYDRALSAAEVQADMSQPLGITNPGAPTTPGNLAVTGSTQTSISLGWTASTDDTGVSGYNVYVDGAAAGTTTATSFTVTGLACSTGHPARGGGLRRGGQHLPARLGRAAPRRPAEPRRAWSRRTRSTRDPVPTANDASGNGKNGAIGGGAAWVTGHSGGALSFDGVDDNVALGSLGTFYNSAFTLEAWVQKTTAKKDVGGRRHLDRHRAHALGRPPCRPSLRDARQQPLLVPRLGAEPARRAVAAPGGHLRRDDRPLLHRRGRGGLARGLRQRRQLGHLADRRLRRQPGRLLRRRGRRRPHLQPRAQRRRNPVRPRPRSDTAGPADGHDPAEPARHADRDRKPRPGQRSSWGAATDNVGVTRYNVHRSTTSGFTPAVAQPDRAADRPELHRHRPRCRHLLLQGHRRGRRRQRRPRLESGRRVGDRRRHDAADRVDHRSGRWRNRVRDSRPSAPPPPTTSRWPACSSGSTASTSAPRI